MNEITSARAALPAKPHKERLAALTAVFLVFGVMGLTGAMATTLVPAVRLIFALNLSAAIAVQWIALVVSGICALPVARLLQRHGAARTTMAGLTLVTLGCLAVALAVLPTGRSGSGYVTLLAALGLVALGNTGLQVAANVMVTQLGERSGGSSRLTLAQGFNSLGVLLGVNIGAAVMLSAGNRAGTDLQGAFAAGTVRVYLLCAVASVMVLILTFFSRRTIAANTSPAATNAAGEVPPGGSAFRSRWALAGAGAIALYVGAEGSIGSILIGFLHQGSILNLPLADAGRYVANFFWGGALVGRFVGGWLLAGRSAPRYLAGAAMLAALASCTAMIASGPLAGMAALAIGLFNAIMFPVIFAITLERASAPPAAVSGLLSMAIGAGALISIAVGWAGDRFGIGHAFAVPMLAYLLIALFGVLAELAPQR